MREIDAAPPGLGPIVGGRWAIGLGVAVVLSVAGIEAAQWRAAAKGADEEHVVQIPAPISTPAAPDMSAPDPGDDS
jgi:hypothetical protein